MMKKKKIQVLIVGIFVTGIIAGCGIQKEQENVTVQQEETILPANTEEQYISAEEDEPIPTMIVEYSETEAYPQLAEFLINYYQIPDEYLSETRYYYNYIDLNEDGKEEIMAVVIGDYVQGSSGGPALLISPEGDTFTVMEDIQMIHTPIVVSADMVDGWHDLIFSVYGGGIEPGYTVCHYAGAEGYHSAEGNEFIEKLDQISGTQILSNNLIDDLDTGNYLTLAPKTETEP